MAVLTPFFDVVAGVAILAGRSSLLDRGVFKTANTNFTVRHLLALGFIGYGGWNLWKIERAQDKLKKTLDAEIWAEAVDWFDEQGSDNEGFPYGISYMAGPERGEIEWFSDEDERDMVLDTYIGEMEGELYTTDPETGMVVPMNAESFGADDELLCDGCDKEGQFPTYAYSHGAFCESCIDRIKREEADPTFGYGEYAESFNAEDDDSTNCEVCEVKIGYDEAIYWENFVMCEECYEVQMIRDIQNYTEDETDCTSCGYSISPNDVLVELVDGLCPDCKDAESFSAEDNSYCANCLRAYTYDEEDDAYIMVEEGDEFWTVENYGVLCRECHPDFQHEDSFGNWTRKPHLAVRPYEHEKKAESFAADSRKHGGLKPQLEREPQGYWPGECLKCGLEDKDMDNVFSWSGNCKSCGTNESYGRYNQYIKKDAESFGAEPELVGGPCEICDEDLFRDYDDSMGDVCLSCYYEERSKQDDEGSEYDGWLLNFAESFGADGHYLRKSKYDDNGRWDISWEGDSRYRNYAITLKDNPNDIRIVVEYGDGGYSLAIPQPDIIKNFSTMNEVLEYLDNMGDVGRIGQPSIGVFAHRFSTNRSYPTVGDWGAESFSAEPVNHYDWFRIYRFGYPMNDEGSDWYRGTDFETASRDFDEYTHGWDEVVLVGYTIDEDGNESQDEIRFFSSGNTYESFGLE